MQNYGLTLKWDLITQQISIVSGTAIYSKAIGEHKLWVLTELSEGQLLEATFSQNGQKTASLTMFYDDVLGQYFTEIPDVVLSNEGKCEIGLLIKSPVFLASGQLGYNVLTSGVVNVEIIRSVAEPASNPVTQTEADRLHTEFQQLDENVTTALVAQDEKIEKIVVPTIAVGETTTLPPEAQATVENVGTNKAGVFNFGIPQGKTGAKGDTGDTGATGEKGDTGERGTMWFVGEVVGTSGNYNCPLPNGSRVGDLLISNSGEYRGNFFEITSVNETTAFLSYKDDLNGAKGSKGDTGNGIEKIEKTSTNGLVDTYTITYTDKTTYLFDVANGADGIDGKDGTNGIDGKNGIDGTDGMRGSVIWAGEISYANGVYSVPNISGAMNIDQVLSPSGAYKGFIGFIENIGAAVTTLKNVSNLNGANGSGAGNVIANNPAITAGAQYVFTPTGIDGQGNISGALTLLSLNGFLTGANVKNVRSNSTTDTYSADFINNSFAPRTYIENLWLEKIGNTSANLVSDKPIVASGNKLSLTTTNTTFDFVNGTKIELKRTTDSNLEFGIQDLMRITLSASFSRAESVEFGANIFINGSQVASNQAFGAQAVTANTPTTITFGVIFDLINGSEDFASGSEIVINVFLRQATSASLTSSFYCGVAVGAVNYFSYANFNSQATSINTNQLADGAVTLPKINPTAFDSAPTQGSEKMLKSGGVFAALAGKANKDEVNLALAGKADEGYVNEELLKKQNTLTFDSTPAQGSQNPVTSGGVYSANLSMQTAITQEAETRASADTTLQNAILEEGNARQTADENLQTAITAETAARETADNTLQTTLEAKANSADVYTKATTDTEIDSKLNSKIIYGTTDLTAGTSPLETGKLYFVYE